MAFLDDMSETARKIFLVGVGAVALTAEKSSQVIDDLVKKGELTVDQGKTLNEELKHKVSDFSSDTEGAFLKARLKNMTPEQREAYAEKVSKIKDDLNAEPVEVEGEAVEVDVETEADVVEDADASAADEASTSDDAE